jgi:hypothetical protein
MQQLGTSSSAALDFRIQGRFTPMAANDQQLLLVEVLAWEYSVEAPPTHQQGTGRCLCISGQVYDDRALLPVDLALEILELDSAKPYIKIDWKNGERFTQLGYLKWNQQDRKDGRRRLQGIMTLPPLQISQLLDVLKFGQSSAENALHGAALTIELGVWGLDTASKVPMPVNHLKMTIAKRQADKRAGITIR